MPCESIPRILRADHRDRHDLTARDVGGRCCDRQRRRCADIERAYLQPVGIGMLFERDDRARQDAVDDRPGFDCLNRKTQRGQARNDRVDIGGQIDVVAQPT